MMKVHLAHKRNGLKDHDGSFIPTAACVTQNSARFYSGLKSEAFIAVPCENRCKKCETILNNQLAKETA